MKPFDVPVPEDLEHRFCAICLDTTWCSVVALDKDVKPLGRYILWMDVKPLGRCILWMDTRSSSQTEEIMEKAKGDPALQINCNGKGPLSAEWMTPKALWIRQNEPEIWEAANTLCEYQDFLNLKLTGQVCASSCNAATRWHWNGDECIKDSKAVQAGHSPSTRKSTCQNSPTSFPRSVSPWVHWWEH